jgi:hypothetical protein
LVEAHGWLDVAVIERLSDFKALMIATIDGKLGEKFSELNPNDAQIFATCLQWLFNTSWDSETRAIVRTKVHRSLHLTTKADLRSIVGIITHGELQGRARLSSSREYDIEWIVSFDSYFDTLTPPRNSQTEQLIADIRKTVHERLEGMLSPGSTNKYRLIAAIRSYYEQQIPRIKHRS